MSRTSRNLNSNFLYDHFLEMSWMQQQIVNTYKCTYSNVNGVITISTLVFFFSFPNISFLTILYVFFFIIVIWLQFFSGMSLQIQVILQFFFYFFFLYFATFFYNICTFTLKKILYVFATFSWHFVSRQTFVGFVCLTRTFSI